MMRRVCATGIVTAYRFSTHDEATALKRPDREVDDELRHAFRALGAHSGFRAVALSGGSTSVGTGGDCTASSVVGSRKVLGRAAALLVRGALISAEEASCIGLDHVVISPDTLADTAGTRAEARAHGPSIALEITRDALNRETHMDLRAALESEAFEAFRDERHARFS